MNGINVEHKIYLKVLTPVHIGGTQEKHLQEDIDTLYYKGCLWKIDWKKVYNSFSADEVSMALVEPKGLYDLLQDDIEDFSIKYSEGYGDTGETKTIIRDGLGRSFIPGSSLKGALKNWLYTTYDASHKGTRNLFGNFETDLFRFIKPYDCYLPEVKVFPVKLFNLYGNGNTWYGGWKHNRQGVSSTNSNFDTKGFVTDYECFLPGQTGDFILNISKEMPTHFKNELYDKEITNLQRKLNNERNPQRYQKIQEQIQIIENGRKAQIRLYNGSPINELFNGINEQLKGHLEKEHSFFKGYKFEYSEKILEEIEKLNQEFSKSSNNCLLRLSAGSGFHGMSGDYQFKDHNDTGFWDKGPHSGKKKYKSRKIAFTPGLQHLYPMGFVLLSTQPFKNETDTIFKEKEVKQEKIEATPVKTSQGQSNLKLQYTTAIGLKAGDTVFGEIIELSKPFHKVKLLLDNYAFEGIADLSGTKGYPLSLGQIIKCKLQQPSKSGEFKTASYKPE